jgi:hypothetical protein
VSAVTRFFFRTPSFHQTAWTILQWWEVRRPAYNLAVGAAGLLTLGTIATLTGLPPFPRGFHLVWDFAVGYAVLANIGYCLGPAIDLLVHRRWGPRYDAIGPALFRYGLVFAVGVTLLPIPLVLFFWSIRLLGLQ